MHPLATTAERGTLSGHHLSHVQTRAAHVLLRSAMQGKGRFCFRDLKSICTLLCALHELHPIP